MTLIGVKRLRVEVKRGRRYAYVTIDLFPTSYDLTAKGIEELGALIANYITSRKTHRKIIKQYFYVSPTYVAFTALKEDVNHLLRQVESVVTANLKETS